MKKQLLMTSLCCLLLLSGCSEGMPDAESIVSPATEADASPSITDENGNDDDITDENGNDDDITDENGNDDDLSEADRTEDSNEAGSEADMAALYMRYSPVIEPQYSFNIHRYFENDKNSVLQQVDEGFYTAVDMYEQAYQEVYGSCAETASTSFVEEWDFQPVSSYDPLTAVLYNHREDMKVNPVELAEKMLSCEEVSSYVGRKTPSRAKEWLTFDRGYNTWSSDAETEGVSHEEYLRNALSSFIKIPEEDMTIGYSEEEGLYYFYLVDFTDKASKNLNITAMYFQFDETTGKMNRCGVETFIRATDDLMWDLYKTCGYNTSDVGYRSFFENYQNELFQSFDEAPTDKKLLGMMDKIMSVHQVNTCSYVLSLMTDGELSYSTDNQVKFSIVDDFHSGMAACFHIRSGHFITWFTLDE